MNNTETSHTVASEQERLHLLEEEFAKATERSRLARQAVKEAKAAAKAAKRDKRRARKALVAAQDEMEAALAAAKEQPKKAPVRTATSVKAKQATKTALGRRIAGTPEQRRTPRGKQKSAGATARPPRIRKKSAADS